MLGRNPDSCEGSQTSSPEAWAFYPRSAVPFNGPRSRALAIRAHLISATRPPSTATRRTRSRGLSPAHVGRARVAACAMGPRPNTAPRSPHTGLGAGAHSRHVRGGPRLHAGGFRGSNDARPCARARPPGPPRSPQIPTSGRPASARGERGCHAGGRDEPHTAAVRGPRSMGPPGRVGGADMARLGGSSCSYPVWRAAGSTRGWRPPPACVDDSCSCPGDVVAGGLGLPGRRLGMSTRAALRSFPRKGTEL